jgi:CubicO group peptidase (beta-lactamase class C family)
MPKPLEMTYKDGDQKSEKDKIETVFYESVKDHKFREWKTFSFFYKDINLSYKWAGGGLVSTPTDLVKMGNKILNDTTYISSETKSLFFEHQKLADGSFNQDNYALGWRTDKKYTDDRFNNPQWIVHHGGVSKGSMNFLVLFPEHNLVIDAAINARAENFGYLWGEVMQIASYFINDLESVP